MYLIGLELGAGVALAIYSLLYRSLVLIEMLMMRARMMTPFLFVIGKRVDMKVV